MPVSNTFFLKKLEQFEKIHVLFSELTRMPYVECDENSGNDCVFFFSDEKRAKEAADEYRDKKGIRVSIRNFLGKDTKKFVSGLYGIGVNIIVLEEEENIQIPLGMISPGPDLARVPNNNIPYSNPELQLTALYFLQEARRKVIRSDEDKKKLRDMEEEMAVNFFRSRFVIALDNTAEPEPDENGKKNYRLPMLKTTDGKTLIPIYSDMGEFQKMNAKFTDMKFRIVPVPYRELKKFMPPNINGVAINPAGFNLVLTGEQLDKLLELYGQE